jgi:tetratricopeptide (TPR) repeat protein
MARRTPARRPSGSKATRSIGTADSLAWTPTNWPGWLTGLFVGAFALRLIAILQLRGTPVFDVLMGDGRQYDTWAQQIAGGQWMGTDVFYQTPLYPYALAVLYKIAGHHLLLVRLAEAVLGAASCVLLAVAGSRFFDRRAGLAAGGLLAVYAPAIFFDVVIQKSSFDLFLMTLTLALLGEFLARPHWKWLAAAGVAIGAFMINRENARVFYPIVAGWLALGPWTTPIRTRVNWIVVFTAAVGATLLPVGLRNYHVGGQFLISTSQLGPNFYIGNHAGAPGVYEPLVIDRGDVAYERADAASLAQAATGRTLSPGEVSDYWMARGLDFARQQPGAWLSLMQRKLLMTFTGAEIADTESVEAYAEYSWLLRVLQWANFGVILPLAVFGLWQTRREWRRLSVLYASMAGMALAVAIFYVMARYRYPLVPLLILFAGAAVAGLQALRRDSPRSWLPGLAAALAVAVLANTFMRETYDGTYNNLGAELTRAGRSAEAVPLLEKAVAAAPTYAAARFNLGVALNETGDKARALEQFSAAVAARPDYFEARSSLALALAEMGRSEEAMAQFETAVRLRPDSAEALCNLGQALAQFDQPQQAMDRFREALRIKPGYPKAHAGLGAVLQQQGRLADAIKEYQAALQTNPDFAEAHSTLALALAAAGDKPGALAHVADALRLKPDNFGIQMNAGNLLASLGQTNEAIASFEKALKLAQAGGRTAEAEEIARLIRALRAR